MKKLADRIFYSDNDNVKSPWNNIGRAHFQLENLGADLESEGKKDDSNELIMLYKIKDLIEKIENISELKKNVMKDTKDEKKIIKFKKKTFHRRKFYKKKIK